MINSKLEFKQTDKKDICQEILRKNRSLRVEIKSELFDTQEFNKNMDKLRSSCAFSTASNISLKTPKQIHLPGNLNTQAEKLSIAKNPAKRDLIKLKNQLLEENDKLLFELKKKFLM